MMLFSWKSNLGMLHNMEEVREYAKSWNMHIVQSLLKEKKATVWRLEGIQIKAHKGITHGSLRRLEVSLQQELHKILCQEELA